MHISYRVRRVEEIRSAPLPQFVTIMSDQMLPTAESDGILLFVNLAQMNWIMGWIDFDNSRSAHAFHDWIIC